MNNNLRRIAVVAAALVTTGLVWAMNPLPAAAVGPTDIAVGCAQATATTVNCTAGVADEDPGADPDPAGTVAFFLDAISTSGFLGQCTLSPLGGPGGNAVCTANGLTVPAGPHTVWAVYYPAAGSPYSGSVDSDDIGNPAVAPPDPTDTGVICAPATPPGTPGPLDCWVVVADDDSDVGPGVTGTVAFFLNAISTSAFLGQCSLAPVAPGRGVCRITLPSVPAGSNTVWAVYYGDANYQGSVESDPIVI
jgi:hypothetical protein